MTEQRTTSSRFTDTTTTQPFYGPLSGTTRVSRYQKKHSPNHHHDHHPIFISFFHLPRSIASSLFNYVLGNLFAQPLSFHVLFGLPLGLDSGALHLIFYTFLHPISVFHRFTDRQQEWHLTTHKFFVQSSLRSRGGGQPAKIHLKNDLRVCMQS